MSCWSAENAQRASLQALQMRRRGREPDVAEFISALAAGKNAQLIVVATGATSINPGSTMLVALAAAAHQTSGRVVCICSELNELQETRKAIGAYYEHCIEFVAGNARTLLLGDYKEADFVLVDCNIDNAKEVFQAAFTGPKHDYGGEIVVGYNVHHRELCWWRQLKTSFLPIGEGLLVVTKLDRINSKLYGKVEERRKSHWIIKVDKCTGEEHIFRVANRPSLPVGK